MVGSRSSPGLTPPQVWEGKEGQPRGSQHRGDPGGCVLTAGLSVVLMQVRAALRLQEHLAEAAVDAPWEAGPPGQGCSACR